MRGNLISESQLIEYKESWHYEYLKWICASFACQNSFSKTRSGLRRFANAQGGVLYIGKRDDGSVCGVADSKQLLQGSALTNFLLRKTGKNRDSVPFENISIDDLDKESFDIFHREAIFNALIHQDFSVGVPVQISVYRDKLYISNDCVFPASWTADTLMQKHRSLPHNPDIANTFFRAGFIESWGRGIEKICNLCKEYGIAEPEYTVHPNDIMMMFKANGNEVLNEAEAEEQETMLSDLIKEIDNHISNI